MKCTIVTSLGEGCFSLNTTEGEGCFSITIDNIDDDENVTTPIIDLREYGFLTIDGITASGSDTIVITGIHVYDNQPESQATLKIAKLTFSPGNKGGIYKITSIYYIRELSESDDMVFSNLFSFDSTSILPMICGMNIPGAQAYMGNNLLDVKYPSTTGFNDTSIFLSEDSFVSGYVSNIKTFNFPNDLTAFTNGQDICEIVDCTGAYDDCVTGYIFTTVPLHDIDVRSISDTSVAVPNTLTDHLYSLRSPAQPKVGYCNADGEEGILISDNFRQIRKNMGGVDYYVDDINHKIYRGPSFSPLDAHSRQIRREQQYRFRIDRFSESGTFSYDLGEEYEIGQIDTSLIQREFTVGSEYITWMSPTPGTNYYPCYVKKDNSKYGTIQTECIDSVQIEGVMVMTGTDIDNSSFLMQTILDDI